MNCTLSNVTKDFLDKYYDILGEMIEEMTTVSNSDSISENFIGIYVPFCRAAAEMSENVLRFTQSLSIQNLADDIADGQNEMQNNLSDINCACSKNSDRDLRLYTRRANAIMCRIFSQMESASFSNSVNQNYLAQMLPLCRGAIDLCENMLRFSVCRELFDLASDNVCTLQCTIKQIKLLTC